jgi:hypothetical protein
MQKALRGLYTVQLRLSDAPASVEAMQRRLSMCDAQQERLQVLQVSPPIHVCLPHVRRHAYMRSSLISSALLLVSMAIVHVTWRA